MGYWLDLHMHSNYSNDGEFPPAVLMQKCAQANLRTVALSDHDSVRGVGEARLEAQRQGLQLISAIELNCQFNGQNLHLLGYGIDETLPVFAEIEKNITREYLAVSAERTAAVRRLGLAVDAEMLRTLAPKGIVMSTMLAEAALKNPANDGHPLLEPYRPGGKRSENACVNFAWDFCVQGKPAYVPIKFMLLEEAIDILHSAGGAAVWAHPGANIGSRESLADQICQTGLDGIEVCSNYHNQALRSFYGKKAAAYRLLATVGSDFHGKAKPSVRLGRISMEQETETLDRLLSMIKNK